MNDIEIVGDFIKFLKTKSLSYQEVCQYFVTVSLKNFNFFGAIYSEIQKNGTVRILHSYGVDKKDVESWQNVPVEMKTPVNDCLIENKIVWVNPVENEYLDYQDINNLPKDERVKTLIAFPVKSGSHNIGSLSLLNYEKIEIETNLERLISTLINLTSLVLESHKIDNEQNLEDASNLYQINKEIFKRLTLRQRIIISLLIQKKTNKEIANQLGYSTSTIKQETMAIYELLGLRGREDTYLLKDKLAELSLN